MTFMPPLPRLLFLGLLPLIIAAAVVMVAALPEAPLVPLVQALLIGGVAAAMVLLYGEGEQHGLPLLAAVLLIALIGRIAAMTLADGTLTAADPMNYQNLARSLLAGDGLVTTDIQYRLVYAHFPPLYPVLLAGFWGIFGENNWSTLAFALACDLVTAWALFDIARRAGVAQAGRIAALLFLLYPAFVISAPLPNKESLTVMLAMLLVRSMLVWADRPADRPALRCMAATGLWWGLLMLTQPSLALLAPCIGLALAPQRGPRPVLRFGIIAGIAAMLVMLPWWVRNYLLFADFVPFTTAGGYLVNVQLGPNLLPFPPGLFDLPEPDRGAVMASAALQWIAAHPIDHAMVLLRRVANVFAYDSAAVEAYRWVEPGTNPGTHGWLLAASQAGWLLLLIGAAAGARRLQHLSRLRWLAPFIILFTASMLTINIWFEFAERHRYALTPFLLLLAALWWTERRRRRQSTQP
jgi:4-amino-4-deoxy-L-arabinose transferase-like glycosyltransferase